ncbi:hypothetical protein H6F86_20945 [Phormidium sp. FACHB-592]|uniref:Uncharacterized protein n=1 Tax=Stenomitos frigidus AS-A4 TaxID=2933935 RepID=A0ABV0KF43_9CYAN|nr:hypothetical protein [Phormidium sp. FACHB-592]MBD2076302.1 hypothetical protein [Phormidium sp. FACHB-592]
MIRDLSESGNSELAPMPPARPGSVAKPAPDRAQLATGKPAPVVKSRVSAEREQMAPIAAKAAQRVNVRMSEALVDLVGVVKTAEQQQDQLADELAQRLAAASDPQAFMQKVMLRTGELLSGEAPAAQLDFDFLGGAREQLALLPEREIDTTSLEAWLQESEQQGQRQIQALAESEL